MDNPETVENSNKFWRDSTDVLHRDDGPAIIYINGHKEWWQHGKRHRDDGPAVVYASGHQRWYLYDQRLSFDGWLNKVDMSDEDKVMMKLQYG
jgi:hypothetical protein